jgi:rhodanese-related sulfurtransferase
MRRAIPMIICLAAGSAAFSAAAITVAGLQKEMAGNEKVTLIDVRDTKEFVQGHIPGAINVPASLCPLKRLPPLGKVVVYDDGLGRRGTAALNGAAGALAQKPGISVDILEGGYAAWQTAQGLTTQGRGLKRETFNYITYSQLQGVAASEVVLVDLRKLTETVRKNSASLTDLSKEFPGRRVAAVAPEPSGAGPLVVLIDSGDGTAEAAARRLKAGGTQRYAILTGGELTIVRKGRPGLERSGPRFDAAAQNQNTPPAGPTGQ